MSLPDVPESLQSLASRLPFPLDDAARVGRVFQKWMQARGEEDIDATREKRIVDLWTYCFVRRYFLYKFAAQPERPSSDLGELVSRVYRKIEEKRTGVREPRRYAHWVSVVCKNTFLNYVNRGRPPDLSLDAEEAPPMPVEEGGQGEMGLAREVVAEAIERLPNYLRAVAQLRLLERCSYQEVSERTGTPVATARTYAARARERLREDAGVQALLK